MGINQLSTKAVVHDVIYNGLYISDLWLDVAISEKYHITHLLLKFKINCLKWYSSQFAKHLTKRIK